MIARTLSLSGVVLALLLPLLLLFYKRTVVRMPWQRGRA